LNWRERSDTAVMDAAAKTKADAMDGGMESGGRNGRRSARPLHRDEEKGVRNRIGKISFSVPDTFSSRAGSFTHAVQSAELAFDPALCPEQVGLHVVPLG